MRLNKYIAQSTGVSRRKADELIEAGKVTINGKKAALGDVVQPGDIVKLDGNVIQPKTKTTTIMLNKPVGYVCSRDGQGSKTIYDLLPKKYHYLKPVGRLDKDSSGLLLLTDDGKLAHELTHPSFKKEKVYEVALDKPLKPDDKAKIEQGVMLEDGLSTLRVRRKQNGARSKGVKTHTSYSLLPSSAYEIHMTEGRNRQIRRTFKAVGYTVTRLHRTQFGSFRLSNFEAGKFLLKTGTNYG